MSVTSTTVIGAEAVLISDLLRRGYFEVPWHQRYYDWTGAHVSVLLRDLEEAISEKRSCYFLGSVILVERSDGLWEVNDGQQRLITISLLCAALGRRFAEEMLDPQREALALRVLFDLSEYRVSSFSDADRYSPRVTPPKNDKAYFNQMIRGKTLGTNGKLTASWRVIEEFLGITSREVNWKNYFDFVLNKVEVACIIVPQNLDPNALFETTNTRGKQLDDLDLIRNFFYSHFNDLSEIQRRETLHVHLERIRSMYPNVGKKTMAQDFVRCQLQCRFGFLRKDSFYEDVREKIRQEFKQLPNQKKPSDIVFNLVESLALREDIDLYRRITSPSVGSDFFEKFEAKSGSTRSPRNLTVFLREMINYKVTHTLIFALMTKFVHESDGRKVGKVARLVNTNLRRLTSFVMRTAFVAPKFEPSHIERDFADYAAEISNSSGIPDAEFKEFLEQCDRKQHNVLIDSTFEDSLAKAEMRGTKKIKSFLLGINYCESIDGTIIQPAKCTIEHVLPKGNQHWIGWPEFSDGDPGIWVHRIGNLTLLSNLDNKADDGFNSNFSQKRTLYEQSSIAITRKLAAENQSWTPQAVEERQRKIVRRAIDVWSFE